MTWIILLIIVLIGLFLFKVTKHAIKILLVMLLLVGGWMAYDHFNKPTINVEKFWGAE